MRRWVVWASVGALACGGAEIADDSGLSRDSGLATDSGQVTDGPPTVFGDPNFEVNVEEAVVYAQGLTHTDWNAPDPAPMDLLLDLYTPVDAEGRRPAAVVIHGGGFVSGSRQNAQLVELAQHFASRGFVSISIDYRLAGDHGTLPDAWLAAANNPTMPAERQEQAKALYAAGRDAKAAVRWLHANAASLGVDPDHIAVMGGSAGAIQAMMLGVTEPEDYRDELDPSADDTLVTTHLDSPSSVHTIVDFWGSGTQISVLEMLYGLDRWDASDAPVLIVHGTEDPTVLFTEAEAIRDAYDQTGVPYAFHPLEGAGHGPWGAEVGGMSLFELAFAFVAEQQGLEVR